MAKTWAVAGACGCLAHPAPIPTWFTVLVVLFAIGGFAGSAFTLGLGLRRRRAAGPGGAVRLVDPLAAVPPQQRPPVLLRVRGGANSPTAYLRVNATWPLAVLELQGDRVSLRLSVPFTGAQPLYARPADLLGVFPVQNRWPGTRGVGLRTFDGREWYFWTFQGAEVLDRLRQQGFPVSSVPQRAGKLWTATP